MGKRSFEDRLERARQEIGSPLDRATEARLREDLRLEDEYQNQYVAFVDRWNGSRLSREILAHGDAVWDLQDQLHKQLQGNPEDERSLVIRFIGESRSRIIGELSE